MLEKLIQLADDVLGDKLLALLSNLINSYSFLSEAMSMLVNLPRLTALAIVVYNSQSQLLTETQNFFISTIKKYQ